MRHLRSHGSAVAHREALRPHVHVACDVCHRRKVKCQSSEVPCRRCKEAGLVCTFSQRDSLPHEGTSPISPARASSIDRNKAGAMIHTGDAIGLVCQRAQILDFVFANIRIA